MQPFAPFRLSRQYSVHKTEFSPNEKHSSDSIVFVNTKTLKAGDLALSGFEVV